MTDVEKSEISFIVCTIYGILLHSTLFCWKICFFFVNLRWFLSQNGFLRFSRFCVEKNLAKNSARGEKMTNMRYAFELKSVQCTYRRIWLLDSAWNFAMSPLKCNLVKNIY